MGCGTSLSNPQNSDQQNDTTVSQPKTVPTSSVNDSPSNKDKGPSEEKKTEPAQKEKDKKTVSTQEPTVSPDSKNFDRKTEKLSKASSSEGSRPKRANKDTVNQEEHFPVSENELYHCDPVTGCCMLKPKKPQSATHDKKPKPYHFKDYDEGPRTVPSVNGERVRNLPDRDMWENRGPRHESPGTPHRGFTSIPVRSKNAATTHTSVENLGRQSEYAKRYPVPDSPTKGTIEYRLKQETRPGQETRLKWERNPNQDSKQQANLWNDNKRTNVKSANDVPERHRREDDERNRNFGEKLSLTKDSKQQFTPPSPGPGKHGPAEKKPSEDANKFLKVESNNTRFPYQSYKRTSECYTESSAFTDKMVGLSFDQEFKEFVGSIPAGYLFDDLDFPADSQSLFFNPNMPGAEVIQWLRPLEILNDDSLPELVSETVTRYDIKQGILGDCWFLSCCAAISKKRRIINKIIPKNQPLYGPSYRGVVRFRFWRFGKWIQVLIDDRLPTVKGKLVYGRCTNPNEFWVALIEKAYAKLHGCYEALGGGITKDAFVDLTGGIAERYDLSDYNALIFKLIYRAHKAGGFIACSRKGDWRLSTMADVNGLVPGHAYTITDAVLLIHKMGMDKLLQIKNPWGDGAKWKGSWNDNDVNWQWVDEDLRDKMLQLRDDGEFWMSYRDFSHQFGEVTICHLTPDLDGDGEPDIVGHMEIIHGEWILGKTAGGSRNNLVKFITNDQYLLTILESDSFNIEVDDAECEGKCNIVIALMQEHRQWSQNVKISSYQIGFFIYESTERIYKLPLQFFRYNPDFAKTSTFINYREVSGRFELYPGHYVIIPTTFLEDCPAHFMLRVFGEKKFLLRGPLLSR